MQHAFRSILCLREPDHGPALPYRRILVPTDLSLASCLAFPMAALFARTFSAEVVALHVVPAATFRSLSGVPGGDGVEVASEAFWGSRARSTTPEPATPSAVAAWRGLGSRSISSALTPSSL